MEFINSAGENIVEENNKNHSAGHTRSAAGPLLAIVLIVLLLAGVFFFVKMKSGSDSANVENRQTDTASTQNDSDSAGFLGDCTPLNEDCAQAANCVTNKICGVGVFETCKIYDCGDTYGIYTKTAGGRGSAYKQAKTDFSAMQADEGVCKGVRLKVLEQECVDGKKQMKVKLVTTGKCEVGDFVIAYEDKKEQPNKSTSLGGGVYQIEVESCGSLSKITARDKEGNTIL